MSIKVIDIIENITRPIIGIENRTAQEVFDIMVARIVACPSPLSNVMGDEPLFWYRPVGEDGGYEGPHHASSQLGKTYRDAMPGQWKPLFTAPFEPVVVAKPNNWMTEPERLWLSSETSDGHREIWFDPDEGGTEYVRAELSARDAARKALEPFAKAAEEADAKAKAAGFSPSFDEFSTSWEFTFGDMRRAGQALASMRGVALSVDEPRKIKAAMEAFLSPVSKQLWSDAALTDLAVRLRSAIEAYCEGMGHDQGQAPPPVEIGGK